MHKIPDEVLLDKLQQITIKLGRAPTKEDIDSSESMPNSSGYMRFGGLYEAYKLLDFPEKPAFHKLPNVSLEMFIELAKQYYNEKGMSPTVQDFNNVPNYPHSSYLREKGVTWNQMLKKAGLPIMSNGVSFSTNYLAEQVIQKRFVEAGIKHKYLTEDNANAPHSFILEDGTKIDIRCSSVILDHKCRFWKFKTHLNSKLEAPDYFICVGLDEEKSVAMIYMVPVAELGVQQQIISINVDKKEFSKYSAYESRFDLFLQTFLGKGA